MIVELTQKYYNDGIFFNKASADFAAGITVLTGCNGYGKSTMLATIRDHCNKNNIKHIYFDSIQNRIEDRNRADFYGDMVYVASIMTASEGESISMSLGKFAQKLGAFVKTNQNEKTLVILMDAVDSGYSIDNIIELKKLLFKTVINDCKSKNIEIYIIISANSYELTVNYPCFDPINCKYISFSDYNDYKSYIQKTRKTKDKRT